MQCKSINAWANLLGGILFQRLKKTTNRLITADNLDEIRTADLLNTSLDRYGFKNLLRMYGEYGQ
jgi:hypothetical protein